MTATIIVIHLKGETPPELRESLAALERLGVRPPAVEIKKPLKKYLTVKEAVAYCATSVSTFYYHQRMGWIAPCSRHTGRPRYTMEALDEYMQRRPSEKRKSPSI